MNAASKLTDEVLPTLPRVHATFEASFRSLAGLVFSRSSNKTTHFRVVPHVRRDPLRVQLSLRCLCKLAPATQRCSSCEVKRLYLIIALVRSSGAASAENRGDIWNYSLTTVCTPTPIDAPSLRAESCLTLEIVDISNCCRVITDA